jgi:RimJ/RimL family protein N-acetyltransferase
MTELATPRLFLRHWRDDDLDGYARICADPEVMRFLGGRTYNRRQSDEQMRAFIQHWSDHGFGLWAVEHKESAAFIGFVGLSTHTWWPGVEVGWRLDRAYWNQGLATEGATASIDYGFAELALERIVSIAARDNLASRRVMEKNGLTFEQQAVLPHSGVEVMILGIDREEWERRR